MPEQHYLPNDPSAHNGKEKDRDTEGDTRTSEQAFGYHAEANNNNHNNKNVADRYFRGQVSSEVRSEV